MAQLDGDEHPTFLPEWVTDLWTLFKNSSCIFLDELRIMNDNQLLALNSKTFNYRMVVLWLLTGLD
jgi:hypothetical protein